MTETSLRSGVYDHAKIEARWQAHWDGETTFRTKDDLTLPKFYVLDMFPYPSGAGLHVGHPLSYTATDIVARYKRHQGFNVLHPMGWDAFGLPAEQYALKTGVHPAETTAKNIENFRRQLKGLGFSYDWSREVNTTDPDYYRWTQWIFLKLYERGLAYQAEVPVNWCPELGTVLANEEVNEGKSEVGGHPVVRRPMKQWMLKITAYADRLLEGLDDLDWPESIKTLQRNWIGKSTGAEVDFKVVTEGDLALRVFTTRPDTLFGATYMVIAPEHPDFDAIVMDGEREACEAYREAAVAKSDLERTDLAKEKTGVFTGCYAINPVNEEQIPIWLADYVMLGYGTGAIMAVPAHDERDFAFAKTFDLKIQEVVSGGEIEKEVWTGEGKLINSGMLDGLDVPEAKARIIAWLEEEKRGWPAVHTKLRDWLFSRQRYWGEPFPLLHHEDGSVSTVSEADLPVILPEVRRYEPSGTGESPLANETEWVEETHPESGEKVSRETHTMPQWAGSCWYYLRYIDPHNKEALIDPDLERYWMSVDLYVGGAEHAVLHLLYARFWHKVLYDVGVVSHDEPFAKLVSQGMILGEDGEKMSKSRGNVVNPDDVVGKYGADAFRLYEMFMGPLTATKPWQTSGMAGTHRFLSRVWRLFINQDGEVVVTDEPASDEVRRAFHGTLAKVTGDIESLSFNTAIASMMEFVNVVTKDRGSMPKDLVEEFLVMLEPFAPHIAEELNAGILEGEDSLAWASWPEVDEDLVTKETVVIPVQVNGKVRGTVEVSAETDEAKLEMMAREIPAVASRLKGATLKTVVVKPGQVVNFVIAP